MPPGCGRRLLPRIRRSRLAERLLRSGRLTAVHGVAGSGGINLVSVPFLPMRRNAFRSGMTTASPTHSVSTDRTARMTIAHQKMSMSSASVSLG